MNRPRPGSTSRGTPEQVALAVHRGTDTSRTRAHNSRRRRKATTSMSWALVIEMDSLPRTPPSGHGVGPGKMVDPLPYCGAEAGSAVQATCPLIGVSSSMGRIARPGGSAVGRVTPRQGAASGPAPRCPFSRAPHGGRWNRVEHCAAPHRQRLRAPATASAGWISRECGAAVRVVGSNDQRRRFRSTRQRRQDDEYISDRPTTGPATGRLLSR